MINKDNTIGEILEMNPKAAEILSDFGMGCLGCPSATMETLEQACYIHGLELEEVLNKLNEKLKEKETFLVVSKGNQIIYNGDEGSSAYTEQELAKMLPDYSDKSNGKEESGYYLDDAMQLIVKQVNFEDSAGVKGSLYLLTDTDSILPEMRQLILDMGISIVLILILTAAVMTIWIYKGIINPIAKLKVATQNIRDGNLDFTLDVDDEDEIGMLCQDFEEMRLRLKESQEEKLQYDKESKELISNISHDLKTPITAIKGYVEGIQDGVASSPEKLNKYIRTIYNKANDMDRLIDKLTFYSKIDTNKIPYNFSKINVAEYFGDCVEEVGLDMETRGIELGYFNYVDNDVMIIADAEQMKRVINNIIGNSLKYLDKKKGIINIRIKDDGDFIQIVIEDNGKGIAAKDLPFIFDRFYRTDISRNSSKGGSGIGLSIVKKILEDHGGKVWATSRAGIGTIMYFVLRKYQEVPMK